MISDLRGKHSLGKSECLKLISPSHLLVVLCSVSDLVIWYAPQERGKWRSLPTVPRSSQTSDLVIGILVATMPGA